MKANYMPYILGLSTYLPVRRVKVPRLMVCYNLEAAKVEHFGNRVYHHSFCRCQRKRKHSQEGPNFPNS